ncbi:fused MFS/spermidine synthase [Kamptonema cortianum]|nr:fused MFS/spermidine synthase [Kamptonema cortianum]
MSDRLFSQSTGMFIAETHTDAVTWFFSVDKFLVEGKTKYQQYQIVDMPTFGKTLFLDYKIQSSLLDEYVYHESMVQPAMTLHPNPKKVLVCGGGEGSTLWHALQHNTVESATMVDLDEELIDMVKIHMPEWHRGAFDDPRSTLVHQDARKWVEDHKGHGYDVILSDLPGPIEGGPALYLYTQEYFNHVADALSDDGIFVLQAGACNETYPQCFASVHTTLETLKDRFPYVRGYYGLVTTFQMPWGFILASKKHDPLDLTPDEIEKRLKARGVKTDYYTPRFHHAMFTLPEYMHREIRKGRVLTDAEPFIWDA